MNHFMRFFHRSKWHIHFRCDNCGRMYALPSNLWKAVTTGDVKSGKYLAAVYQDDGWSKCG